MFKKSKVVSAVLTALGGALLAAPLCAQAQEAQRIEITGSSIKRIAEEGALPVITLTSQDIAKTGATSITDLIQSLPAMQGFVPSSSSINGGGGGVTTAALHSLPSKYTLVLLDGKRVAPFGLGSVQGGGFGVNLESIPIAAVERIEILTDGASATYGSDAIAGVVNFILKKNKTDGEVSVTVNSPQHSGGGSWNAAISKGFGNLDTDRFNVLLSYSHDHQDKLDALQRSFSATGAYFPFSANGQNYIFNARTSNTEPANLTFSSVPVGSPVGTATKSYLINPYYALNGNCGNPLAGALPVNTATSTGVSCRFNYAATVENIPETTRDSGLIKGIWNLSPDMTLWAELALTSFELTGRFAPSAQPLPVSPTANGTLWNKYIVPYVTANNLTLPKSANMGYRSVSLGGRTDKYQTDSQHFVLGLDGSFKGWDYNSSLTLSYGKLTDTAAGGYSDFNQLSAAIASGAYDPVMGTGQGSVASAILNSQFSKTQSTLNTLHFGAQHDLFKMDGGMSVVALGADYTMTRYKVGYSDLILSQSGFSTQPASSNYPVGGNYGQVPFDASRNNWGVFGEVLLPVVKQFEVTASARYDSYAKTHSNYVFGTAVDPVTGLQNQVGNADLGNTFNSATGKLSFKFTPVDALLLRGSYGTGFKAPNLGDIAGALTFAGSTSGSYTCPFPGSAGCLPGSAQYDLVAGPNGLSGAAGLKPEKSNQWTVGFRFDPIPSVSIGMDLWNVKIRQQVLSSGIAEQVGFANPAQYANLFINPYQDPAGFTTIAFQQVPFNGGQAEYQGIDWDFIYRTSTGFGKLTAEWTGTQMLKQRYNFGPGLPFNSDLGIYGPDQAVVFRTVSNFFVSLQSGDFTNTLAMHYKSGYKDESYPAGTDVFLAKPDGSLGSSVDFAGLQVPSYTTFDWQGKYNFNKSLQLTLGIKNLADRKPPLSLQTGGGGNQVGYDGRYADPMGRLYYLGAQYKF